MAWIPVYKASSQLVDLPFKSTISINSLSKNIDAGEQVYADLQNKVLNKKVSSNLEEQTDDYSYLVVYEDNTDEDFFVPVKSKIVDNLVYFETFEKIEKDSISDRYYAIYYGVKNIKYVQKTTDNQNNEIYVIPDNPTSSNYHIQSIDNYPYIANENSELYSLAYYNSGTDWIDGVSKKIGAKAFGFFEGPRLKIIGSKGKQYGTFRIRIFAFLDDETISPSTSLDWTEIDCYSGSELANQVLFEKQDLSYDKYIFEIETLPTKNISSDRFDVKIDSYMFSPDYGLIISGQNINLNVAFVTIAGVR